MNTFRRLELLAQLARWRLTWNSFDLDAAPAKDLGAKFITARQAVSLIPDGATVIACGMGAHHRPSILYRGIQDSFLKTGRPRDLTVCAVGGIGGRGRIPGTIEELGQPGLVRMAIMGHLETAKSFLRLASAGQMELHTLAQGELSRLVEAQTRGVFERTSEVGVGTFLDPRTGTGSPVTKGARHQYIEPADTGLRYRLPKLEVAIICAPYCDQYGNIYVNNAACLTEIHDSVRAVAANGGLTIVTVSAVIPHDPSAIYVSHEDVSAIVVNPHSEQSASIPQRHYWRMFISGAKVDEAAALEDIRFINRVLGITPYRGPVDMALARLAATVVASEVKPGALINVGVGLPEMVGAELYEAGLAKDLTQTTETGIIGGIPANGIYFGACINPERQVSSADIFRLYETNLSLACFGMLEVDSEGNVNASKRGDSPLDYVGPGGLPNIATFAKSIVIVGGFASNCRMRIEDGRVVVVAPGRSKFVSAVREITFSGPQALRRGQRVWYVTPVGLFRLTTNGLTLAQVMPGIDVDRDILAHSQARIHVDRDALKVASQAVLTGHGFKLSWV